MLPSGAPLEYRDYLRKRAGGIRPRSQFTAIFFRAGEVSLVENLEIFTTLRKVAPRNRKSFEQHRAGRFRVADA